jgi:hypothetical protein
MMSKAKTFLFLSCLLMAMSPRSHAQDVNNTVGEIDVKWAHPQEPLTGIARKFYPGDRLVISITGEYTQHDTRTENHCTWLIICNDVDVPDPHKHSPASDQPAQILFLYEDASPVPSLPNAWMVGPSTSILIPYDKVDEYAKAIKLVAWIPGAPRREISDGLYTLTVQVDSSERLKALETYLRSGAKRESELRNPDVLNERLCVQHPSEVASLIADHAAKFFSDPKNPLSADEYPLLMKLAQSYSPRDSSLFAKLADYYVVSGDYQGAEKNAMDALRNAKDDDERADAYLKFGEISEQKTGGLEGGALATAASFYAQASDGADKNANRSIQLAALVAQARVLRRTRTIATLAQSAALLERARSLTPISVEGVFSGLTEDGKSALVSRNDNGFYVDVLDFGNGKPVGKSPHGGALGEHWFPLAINGEGKVLVTRESYSLDWWDITSGSLTNVGNADVQGAVIAGSSVLAMTKSGDLVLYLPGRAGKTLFSDKWHDRFPTNPGEIPVGKLFAVAISGDGSRYAFASVAPGGNAFTMEITVEDQNAQSVAKFTLDKTQVFHTMTLSSDGAQLAAIVDSGFLPGTVPTRNLVLWSVGTGTPAARATDSNGKEFTFDMPYSINFTTGFSPDGNRVYVATGAKLHVFKVQGWKLEKSIEVNLVTGLPAGQHAEEIYTILPDGKLLLSPLYAPPGVPSDIALYDPATDQIVNKKDYRLTNISQLVSGMKPVLLTAQKDGTILSVRPTVNMTLAQTSLVNGAVLHSASYENPLDSFIYQKLVANQTFLHVEPAGGSTKLVGQDGGGTAKDLMQNPLFLPTEYGPSEWQMFETEVSLPAFSVKSLHVFNELSETATYAVATPPKAALAAYQPGGQCVVPPFVSPAFPATWTFFGDSVLAPSYFFFMSQNAPHQLVDMPILLMHSNAAPSLTTRTAVSCAVLSSGSSSKDAALFQILSFPAGPDSLVLAEGVPTRQMVPVFSSVSRGGKFPSMGGVFSRDGEVFLASYRTTDSKAALWRFSSTGFSQIACPACDRASSSTLERFIENVKIPTGFPYPPFALLASSGKRVAVTTSKGIEVQDVDSGQLLLKIPVQVPLALTNSCAIAQDRDRHLLLWRY